MNDDLSAVCRHGGLRRACETCDLQAQVERDSATITAQALQIATLQVALQDAQHRLALASRALDRVAD